MKNNFNYEMPAKWSDIPEEYKWVALNYRYNFQDKNEGLKIIYYLCAFKEMPYPFCHDDEIIWLSDNEEPYTITFDYSEEDNIRNCVLQHVGGGKRIETGKAFWNRL